MELKEFSGKTVEEAITEATVSLGIKSTELYYEVVEKGSSGLFGIGSKEAVIKACLKSEYEEEKEKNVKEEEPSIEASNDDKEIKEEAKEDKAEERIPIDSKKAIEISEKFLQDVFEKMDLEVKINSKYDESNNYLNIDLEGPEMGIIIGKRGQTLDSLQYLTNLAVNRSFDGYVRVKIDTEDYRRRRRETLENFAHNTAHKVKKTGRPVVLEAMNPYERRIIHAALSNNDFVQTHSEGQEPYRHVVVTLKR